MADEAKLPTEEEIAQLPRWARVAFAARCAQMACADIASIRETVSDTVIKAVIQSVQQAILSASRGRAALERRSVENMKDTVEAARTNAVSSARYRHWALIAESAWAALCAASQAAGLAKADADYTAGRHAPQAWAHQEHVARTRAIDDLNSTSHAAGRWAVQSGVPAEALSELFGRLMEESARRKWADDSPIPMSIFSVVDGESPSSAFVVELFAPEGTTPHVIGDSLVKLWEAANEYHMARGGGVLTFDEFKQMVPALVPVGPKSEG